MGKVAEDIRLLCFYDLAGGSMKTAVSRVFFGALFWSAASIASAEDAALLIANDDYFRLGDVPEVSALSDTADILKNDGFTVFAGDNSRSREMWNLAMSFRDASEEADRLIVVLGGHIVHSERDSWLLGSRTLSADALTVGGFGLSVGAILEVLGSVPGGAVLMVAASDDELDVQGNIESGLGTLSIPQGITVIKGPAQELRRILSSDLLNPERSLSDVALRAGSSVEVLGFTSKRVSFAGETPVAIQNADADYWDVVRSMGTLEAALSYLDRYPNGQFRDEANQLITEFREAPVREAEATEDALQLTRQMRIDIQRSLSTLGFDPRGVDGIFGRGTRAAIMAWQKDNGFDETGYLTGNQIGILRAAATRRAAEFEEEERQRQLEVERQDRAYWDATGRSGEEADLRVYLERYPDGVFSDIAKSRLAVFNEERRSVEEAEERAIWDNVVTTNTAEAYRGYLEDYPDGLFSADARARLEALEGGPASEAEIAAARAEERRVANSSITRLLIERRLAFLGLEPGVVNGQFDRNTRRAIRRFQRAQDLAVTGFVTQQTLVRLLVR
jgi:peptidoglycan hydrolase-like protein with peptidoglycan-binding domain